MGKARQLKIFVNKKVLSSYQDLLVEPALRQAAKTEGFSPKRYQSAAFLNGSKSRDTYCSADFFTFLFLFFFSHYFFTLSR